MREIAAGLAAVESCFCHASGGQDAPPVRPHAGQGRPGQGAADRAAESLAQHLSSLIANLIGVPFQNSLDGGDGRGAAFRYTRNVQPASPLTPRNDRFVSVFGQNVRPGIGIRSCARRQAAGCDWGLRSTVTLDFPR